MNELEPLSPEALQFLNAHRETGTPTADELRRARERVVARVDDVVPLRRGWRLPEVWAVAAVVAVAVVGQFIYLSTRGPRGVELLNEAWSAGSMEQLGAAVARCEDDACRARGQKMVAAISLASRVSELSADELSQLEALDAELSREGASSLAPRLAQRRQELDAATTVNLVKGTKGTLRVKHGLQRIAIGDPSIVEVAVAGDDTLELTATATGVTTVLLWFSEGPRQTLTVTVH